MSSAVRLIRSPRRWDGVPYADAAEVVAGARLIHLAGACPLDEDGRVVGEDVRAQAVQCLRVLRQALADAGAEVTDVVSTRVLVATTQRADLTAAWQVVHDAFAAHEVPSTLLGVTVLGWPGQLVEIEAVAAISPDPDPHRAVVLALPTP